MDYTAIIHAKNLKKSYQNLTVVDVAEIAIAPNKITTIIGPSGAGKSTLLHILGTLLKPTSGEVKIFDKDILRFSEKELAQFRNQELGFVFQQHNLLPEFTALENVTLPAMIAGKRPEEYKRKAGALLDYMGLKERHHHKPSEMSGGEQQRVSIARALINDPKIILADEPTGNLDSKNAEDIHTLFYDLKRDKGLTFLIVTHNKDLAKMADKLISMRDGHIVENNINE